jgi:hypothetical protein
MLKEIKERTECKEIQYPRKIVINIKNIIPHNLIYRFNKMSSKSLLYFKLPQNQYVYAKETQNNPQKQ